MATSLLVGDAIRPNAISAYLLESLPADFMVVAAPVIGHCVLDVIVVGPGGLTLIAAEESRAAPPPPGDAHSASRGRATASYEQVATTTVQKFLNDIFPELPIPVHYLEAVRDTVDWPPGWHCVDPTGGLPEALAEAVARSQSAASPVLNTDAERDKVALALRDRRFTVSLRASRPFVFRRGGMLGTKSSAWTIRDAVKHMDRHPQDGIYHLYNGTLEFWLAEQGAADLAKLARVAMDKARADRLKALEIFLAGTGLVEPPRLVARPKVLDMGYAVTGEAIVGHVRVSRGKGRGYLFGTVKPGSQWLRAWPGDFAGGPVDLVVTADTVSLPIRTEPYEDHVILDCNATDTPILLPVRVRVEPKPTRSNRLLFRPFVGLLLGLILGLLIGLLWTVVAPALPAQLTTALHMSPALIWLLAVTLLWAVAGLIRGLLQPLPWSVFHAARGWFLRLAVWTPILVVAGVGLTIWWQNSFGTPETGLGLLPFQAALAGLTLATIPATAFSVRRHPAPVMVPPARLLYVATDEPPPGASKSWARERARGIAWGALGVILVLLVLIFAPGLARTNWTEARTQGPVAPVLNGLETGWSKLNASVNDLVDRVYLHYYDRRAPLPPTVEPTVEPTIGPLGTPTAPVNGGG